MDYTVNEDNIVPVKAKNRILNSTNFIFSMFNLATFIEYFNLQFLPSCIRALEMSLGLSPTEISSITMAESIGLVAFVPIWGALSDKVELRSIMLFGVVCSGIVSIILGGISNFTFIIILRVINGAMMGSVTPSSQKFIVTRLKKHFGIGFGILHSVMCAARLSSSIVVTKFSTEKFFGKFGWRICLYIFGSVSLVLSPLLLIIPKLNKQRDEDMEIKTSFKTKAYNLLHYLYSMFKYTLNNATSILMVFMGFFSDGPFTCFAYVTLLLQYMGLSNFKSGLTVAIVILGGIVGGVTGGLVSDYFNKKSPRYGLLLFGNLNVIIRLITFSIAYFGINIDTVNKLYPLLAIALFINGTTFMTVSCVDRTVLANVVPEAFQSSAISIVRFLGGIASSLVFNPLLAKLRESLFGFEKTTLDVKDMSRELMKKNSDALRYSISIVSLGCTGIVFLIYVAMLFTYWRDAKRIQKIEMESPVNNPIDGLVTII